MEIIMRPPWPLISLARGIPGPGFVYIQWWYLSLRRKQGGVHCPSDPMVMFMMAFSFGHVKSAATLLAVSKDQMGICCDEEKTIA